MPNDLSDRDAVRRSVVAGAEKYLATLRAHPYGLPYAPSENTYDWGSNNLVLNNMVVMAAAFDLTGDERFRGGVLEGIDYILGRNALNQSYVTGYGEVASHNQHSRWYAHQLNPALPNPPRGTLAGGPNSGIQDPVAQQKLQGCAPQFCYIDDIESWSTNELTINWNAPLSWVSAFVADQNDGRYDPHGTCAVAYTRKGPTVKVTITNTGTTPVNGWELRFSFLGGQTIRRAWDATTVQSGATVTAINGNGNRSIKPGTSVHFGFIADAGVGANPTPGLFTLNGAACA